MREESQSWAVYDRKTPLTSIRGLAQLAQRQVVRLLAREAAPLMAQVEGIEAATARMTRQIDTVSEWCPI